MVMRSRHPLPQRVLCFAFLFCGVCSVGAGCGNVLGLADEVPRRPAPVDATPALDVTAPDAPEDSPIAAEAGPVYPCGLGPSPNAECARKNEIKCCKEATACSQSADCVKLFDCIFACAGNTPCIQVCINAAGGDQASGEILACSASIPECLPSTPPCIELGRCCRAIPETPATAAPKDLCNNAVLKDDPTECLNKAPQLAPYCPVDAGLDAPLDVGTQ